MAEYIERDAVHDLVRSLTKYAWASPGNTGHRVTVDADDVDFGVDKIPSADVAPVRHGRWIKHEETPEDAYWHHKCSECNVNAPFDYKMREDWDEGMDGEWYSLGLVDDGINEHLTDYCPNCGAKMDGET